MRPGGSGPDRRIPASGGGAAAVYLPDDRRRRGATGLLRPGCSRVRRCGTVGRTHRHGPGAGRETRRALFGFSLNAAPLFARGGAQEEIDAIESTLVRAREGSYGKWVFVLENGSVWRQIDSERLSRTPRAGMEIRVRQGAIGSYLLSVAGARSIRVQREE